MPNLKIHVSDAVWHDKGDALTALLGPIRDMLCDEFRVGPEACQLAIIPIYGLSDQPPVAVEIQIMPRPERDRAQIMAASQKLQALLSDTSATHVAVRVSSLDPVTYVALK